MLFEVNLSLCFRGCWFESLFGKPAILLVEKTKGGLVPLFARSLHPHLPSLFAMASRSRSRERILSTAVMVELHKLPQSERQAVQKLKTSIAEISQLASLGGFTRILKDVAQQAICIYNFQMDVPQPLWSRASYNQPWNA